MTKRIEIKEILVPGAQIFTGKVDVDSNPELKALFDETHRRQQEAIDMQKWTQEDHDSMYNVITI